MSWFKKVVNKIKCAVLRVPNTKTLTNCFIDEFRHTSNPVTRRRYKYNLENNMELNLAEVEKALAENEKFVEETRQFVKELRESGVLKEYRKEAKLERPKFKLKNKKRERQQA